MTFERVADPYRDNDVIDSQPPLPPQPSRVRAHAS